MFWLLRGTHPAVRVVAVLAVISLRFVIPMMTHHGSGNSFTPVGATAATLPSPAGSSAGLVSPVLAQWSTSGTIVSSHGFAGQPVGGSVTQPWRFYRACSAPTCPVWFARQTHLGTLTTKLAQYGDRWIAAFPPHATTCHLLSGGTIEGQITTTFLLAVSADRHAIDATEYANGNCGHAQSTIRWTAQLR